MEIEIAKKTREMELRVRQLKLIKQIKVLDEGYKAAIVQRQSDYDDKDAELKNEIS